VTDTTAPTALDTATREAAQRFAAALAESPAFAELEAAQQALSADEAAQASLSELRSAQGELGWRARAGALTQEERDHLERLQNAALGQPAIQRVQAAQQQVRDEAGQAAAIITEATGAPFPAPSGCCG